VDAWSSLKTDLSAPIDCASFAITLCLGVRDSLSPATVESSPKLSREETRPLSKTGSVEAVPPNQKHFAIWAQLMGFGYAIS
jgi:hypothetical protein